MSFNSITYNPTYISRATELTGREDLLTTTGSLSIVMKQLALLVPPGSILSYGGNAAPDGFLLCDGSAVNRNLYFELFSVIGTNYGNGDGATTFNLPDLKGRFLVGLDAGQTEFDIRGETGGAKTHTLTIDEMPSHNHNGNTQSAGTHTHVITDPGHNHGITDPQHSHTYLGVNSQGAASGVDNVAENSPRPTETTSSSSTGITINNNTTGITNQNAGAHTHVIDSQGGGLPHNNLPPYMVVNYIIKV